MLAVLSEITSNLHTVSCHHATAISSRLGRTFCCFHPYFLPPILCISARVNFSKGTLNHINATPLKALDWPPIALKLSTGLLRVSCVILPDPAPSPFLPMLALYCLSNMPALFLQCLPLPPSHLLLLVFAWLATSHRSCLSSNSTS